MKIMLSVTSLMAGLLIFGQSAPADPPPRFGGIPRPEAKQSAPNSAPAASAPTISVPNSENQARTDLLKIEYDEFRDDTSVTTLEITVSTSMTSTEVGTIRTPDLKISFWSGFKGKTQGNNIDSFTFYFMSDTKEWQYLEFHPLICILDDSRMPLGDGKHDGTVGSGYVLEYITYDVTREFLMKLAVSNVAKCRLGVTDFVIEKNIKEAIKQLLVFLPLKEIPVAESPAVKTPSKTKKAAAKRRSTPIPSP